MKRMGIWNNKGEVGKTALCFFLGGTLLALSIFTLFTARQIFQMKQLEADRDRIHEGKAQIQEDNRKLRAEIESLNTKEGLEEYVRNQGMVGKDELLYLFK